MILQLIILTISIIVPTSLGYYLLKLVGRGRRFSVPVSLVVSYGLGTGMLTHIMLVMGIMGFKYSFLTICAACCMVGVVILLLDKILKSRFSDQSYDKLYLVKAGHQPKTHKNSTSARIFTLLFWMYIIYYSVHIIWFAFNVPIYAWDSIATSVYNAKVIYYESRLINLNHLSYPVYPLHMPLLLVWTAINLGVWDDQYIKIIYPCFFFAFSYFYYTFLKYYTNNTWAKIGVFLLCSSNMLIYHAAISYREIILLYYTGMTIMFIILWCRYRELMFLLIASLFAGFATFTKLEGTPYLLVHYLIVSYVIYLAKNLSIKRKLFSLMTFVVPSAGIFLIYYIYKMNVGVSTVGYMFTENWSAAGNLMRVLRVFYTVMFYTSNWNILWFILLFSLVCNIQIVRNNLQARLLFLWLLGFLGIYMSLPLFLEGMSGAILSEFTISRLFLHFFPVIPLLIVFLNYREETIE